MRMENARFEKLSYEEARDALIAMGLMTSEYGPGGNLSRCPMTEFHKNGDAHPSLRVGANANGDAVFVCTHPVDPIDMKRHLGFFEPEYVTEEERDTFDWVKQAAGEERPKFTVIDGDDDPNAETPYVPPAGWERIDLKSYTIDSQPAPAHGFVELANFALFYPASVNEVHGKSESMKTWVALVCLVEAVKRGEYAVFLDFEDGAGPIVARLRSMGLDDDDLDRVDYRYITAPVMNNVEARDRLLKHLTDSKPSIAIINGVIEALAVQGLDTNDNRGYTAWVRLYTRPLADAGACVILIDHTTIKDDSGNGSAIGATAKMNIVQGASYLVEIGQELAPAKNKPVNGWTALKLWKDRPGHIRQHGFKRKDVVAELHVTSHPGGKVDARLEAASDNLAAMMGDAEEQAAKDTCQRTLWLALVNNRSRGGLKKTDLVNIGSKAGYGRNQTERLVEAWVNGGFVTIRTDGPAKFLIAEGDIFPDERVHEEA